MIVQAIRSAVFYLLFFLHTIILAIIVGLMAKLTPGLKSVGWGIAQYWNGSNLFFLRWVVGIRTEVTGVENIPQGGCIIGAKHQSDWDIFAILPHVGHPAFIAKKELLDIPLFGWAARWIDTISVDRKKGKDALPAMMEEARDALDRGCRVIIFPEGTRRAPLDTPAYRSGIVRMYLAMDVPVVPVALTSGLYWGRNSLILWPGTARAKFLEPIAPGLSGEDFLKTLIARIESETDAMVLEDARKGLARPISPRLRARLDELEAQSGTAS
ncbi:lysophospholipid acyltransferase family protein [Pelagibacterium halotolerans]|uniref:1-acyl-sn-glycerol-3-phosphate acyltransferase n=1 Tax=Pelagibacterium halotolerans (strain DSM 22347 / JCM 15775 / CGMCC 1.7692 / B2) TaxID=1082931 RepID=G4RF42_PELHB|nr:lysophospholipid acyltransferase family protein [Pelagibacterium halotolerans]AEQ52972.1 1-acyl-sn-glycerol-3-phosphate acyltransferase [Pelagibacterium halotolerans B2]QJR17367.1 1-acyl-sn-glycerol-3-phosphate acyltransferase [Pelagibacterium halotolerans]SEA97506.1 1-acyl-sn-glycerol-3-phosphate acyltransferase [Pelagibacterium halotolerans]